MAKVKFTITDVKINELLSGVRSGEGIVISFAASDKGREIIKAAMEEEYKTSKEMRKYPLEKILAEFEKLEESYFHIYMDNLRSWLYWATITKASKESGKIDFEVEVEWHSEGFAYVSCCESAWE